MGERDSISVVARTHFLSWPPLISSILSWERRSGSIVAGVYVAAALGILSLVGGGRREFCDIVGELGSRDGCAGRGARRWAGLFLRCARGEVVVCRQQTDSRAGENGCDGGGHRAPG